MRLFATAALLSSAFAKNRMYQFGTGPDMITVLGDDNVDQYHEQFMHQQCEMLSELEKKLAAQTHIPDLGHLLKPFVFYNLAKLTAELHVPAGSLASVATYTTHHVEGTLQRLNSLDFQPQYMLLVDGTHLELDKTKRVSNIRGLSRWDTSWREAMYTILPTHVNPASAALETLQLLGKFYALKPFANHCKSIGAKQSSSPRSTRRSSKSDAPVTNVEDVLDTVLEELKKFPYVKGYNHNGERLFHNVAVVGNRFYGRTLDFSIRMKNDIEKVFQELAIRNPSTLSIKPLEFSREAPITLPNKERNENTKPVRWLVTPSGTILTYTQGGQLIQDLGEGFDDWFSDWLQLKSTVQSLLTNTPQLTNTVLPYVQDLYDDFIVAQSWIHQILNLMFDTHRTNVEHKRIYTMTGIQLPEFKRDAHSFGTCVQ
eukprot:Lankesteria_metandrocarpae@DN3235_c0_g1_i1.p1